MADQVTLRPVTEDDLSFIELLNNDPARAGKHEWHGWSGPGSLRREWAETGLLGDAGGMLMVVRGADQVGCVSWRKTQTGAIAYCWSLGIGLAPEFRGHGHGTTAQRLLVRYLFAHTQVNRIQAETETTNIAEQRALEKAGFTREGVARGAAFRAGRWHDNVLYGVLRAEVEPDADGTISGQGGRRLLPPGRPGTGALAPGGFGVPSRYLSAVFTPEDRERLRDELVSAARADDRIEGAALTGSAALGAEDRWSDIDLALGLAAGADLSEVMADWTEIMYRDHGAVDHLDIAPRATVYRVYLLASTLQVDLAFSPAAAFGAIAPTFRLIFGTPAEQPPSPPPGGAELVGLGWLYALHARSSIARGRVWQAEYMISGVRDHVLALACLRHGVPAVQGRGIDRLPPDATAGIAGALVRSLDIRELARAFRVATEALLAEAGHVDGSLAARLSGTLRELAR